MFVKLQRIIIGWFLTPSTIFKPLNDYWFNLVCKETKEWKALKCPQLDDTNLCKIYDTRPFCCRKFPSEVGYCTHLPKCELQHAKRILKTEFNTGKICFDCGAYCCNNIIVPSHIKFNTRQFMCWLSSSCKFCPTATTT